MSLDDPDARSLAAFSVVESLILELCCRDVVSRDGLLGVLDDAAKAHEQQADEAGDRADSPGPRDRHRVAAELIRALARQLHIS
jgi:hypothetical protein